MPAFTSFALAAMAATTAYSAYNAYTQGQEQQKLQEKALVQQQTAQAEAKAATEAQAKSSEMAINAATKKAPDISSIMEQAGESSKGGATSTMLTGPMGIDTTALSLGKKSLLGS